MIVQMPKPEMVNFYVQRTKMHIARVTKCLSIVSQVTDFNQRGELTVRGKIHDRSKFEEKEMIPYVWLTEFHRCKLSKEPFSYPIGIEERVRKAINHHLSTNRHHPEFHANPNEMTEIDLIEMVCDWTAMSQEFNQDNGSAKGWANKTIGTRILFNETKKKFVYYLVDILDKDHN